MLLLPLAVFSVIAGPRNGWLLAAAVSAAAGMTDALDGYAARRTGRTTALGARLDLIADKVFVGAMFAVIASYGIIPPWLPAVIVLREVLVGFLRWRDRSGAVAPDAWGKTKTAASYAAIVLLLLKQWMGTAPAFTGGGAHATPSVLYAFALPAAFAATALTVISGVRYLCKSASTPWRTQRHSNAPVPAR